MAFVVVTFESCSLVEVLPVVGGTDLLIVMERALLIYMMLCGVYFFCKGSLRP